MGCWCVVGAAIGRPHVPISCVHANCAVGIITTGAHCAPFSLLFQRRWQAKPVGGFLYVCQAVTGIGKGNPQSALRTAPLEKEPEGNGVPRALLLGRQLEKEPRGLCAMNLIQKSGYL